MLKPYYGIQYSTYNNKSQINIFEYFAQPANNVFFANCTFLPTAVAHEGDVVQNMVQENSPHEYISYVTISFLDITVIIYKLYLKTLIYSVTP